MVLHFLKNIIKLTLASSTILLLFLIFSSESITFSVPSSITEFSAFMDSQQRYNAIITEAEDGYYQNLEYEAYERSFSVDQHFVYLSIFKYENPDCAKEIYESLKHQNAIKMTFDIDGNSYIRFKVDNVNYCAWHNKETVVIIKSESKEALQTFKNFLVKELG